MSQAQCVRALFPAKTAATSVIRFLDRGKELELTTKKDSPVKRGGLFRLRPIGKIRSILKTRAKAPRQGSEGAPDAWLEVSPSVAQALDGLKVGDDVFVD
jgi:hypothetical protein